MTTAQLAIIATTGAAIAALVANSLQQKRAQGAGRDTRAESRPRDQARAADTDRGAVRGHAEGLRKQLHALVRELEDAVSA